MRNRVHVLLLLALLLTWSLSAQALSERDKQKVRTLSNQAVANFERGRYVQAREEFARAFDMAPVPRLAVWCARANEKLGHLSAAYEYYQRALHLERNDLWRGDLQEKAQADARTESEKLKSRLAWLTIALEPPASPQVEVSIDGKQLPTDLLGVERFVDPGQRLIVAKRGTERVDETVTLHEGERKRVVLAFRDTRLPSTPATADSERASPLATAATTPKTEPPARETRSTAGDAQRRWGWVGVGIGGAGLLLGVVTGTLVGTEYGHLSNVCDSQRVCGPEYQSDVERYRTLRTLSTVGFVTAGVAGTAGLTLLLTTPKPRPKATVGLLLSPGLSGIRGEF